jgi:hypothetical protein
MTINIISAGDTGAHSFKKVNVNYEDNFIYFKAANIPGSITNGSSYIYSGGVASIGGLDNQDLVYAQKPKSTELVFNNAQGARLQLSAGSTTGVVSLNAPVVFDGKLNLGLTAPTGQAAKYYTAQDPMTGLVSGQTYYLRSVEADFTGTQFLYPFTSHSFSSCGRTGRVGPTKAQMEAAYSTNFHVQNILQGDFVGYQDWKVPVSGVYSFDVRGASGFEGSGPGAAGRGARVSGRMELIKGEIITLAIGQLGEAPQSGTVFGGSGGGSFVVRKSNSQPLFIAGGGSADTNVDANNRRGKDGLTATNGG